MTRLLSVILAGLLFCASQGLAVTSNQYVSPGTAKVFGDSAQTPDVTWTLSALASGAGRISARFDKGSGAQPALWELKCRLQLTGTNVVGASVEFYISPSDGTNPDGEIGTADAALTTDKRRDLTLAGVLVVDQTTTNTTMTRSFQVYVPNRYFSLGVWNATTLPFKTDTAVHRCTATPMVPQMQ